MAAWLLLVFYACIQYTHVICVLILQCCNDELTYAVSIDSQQCQNYITIIQRSFAVHDLVEITFK